MSDGNSTAEEAARQAAEEAAEAARIAEEARLRAFAELQRHGQAGAAVTSL